jgi:MoCo/4Fe-4S cofactor protein with predicted Tat translocation signal
MSDTKYMEEETPQKEAKAAGGQAPQWRSLADFDQTPEFIDRYDREFPPTVDPKATPEIEIPPVDRRKFLNVMGASMAAAGLSLNGCIRKPKEKILPFTKRPEFHIPGQQKFYATSAVIGGSVMGLLASSMDGRPTKIEGNPLHPNSLGGANSWAQGEVLELYDPDRGQQPTLKGKKVQWPEYTTFMDKEFAKARSAAGEGLALLLDDQCSPTLRGLLQLYRQRFPKAEIYFDDPNANASEGARLLGIDDLRPAYNLRTAKVVVSLDCDFIGTEGDTVRLSRHFADGRRLRSHTDGMNRLYAVDPALSSTGAMADNRLAIPSSEVGDFLKALAGYIFSKGTNAAPGGEAMVAELRKLAAGSKKWGKWIPAIGDDLINNRGRCAILVGRRQPGWAHALASFLNVSLGGLNNTVSFVGQGAEKTKSLADLAKAIKAKSVKTLAIIGGNPAYDAPADLGFAALLPTVPVSIHHSLKPNETSKLSSWYVPASHFLEAWGDLQAADGTISYQQPLIAPLYNTPSAIEFLARVALSPEIEGYKLVRKTWITDDRGERNWRAWLHRGFIKNSGNHSTTPPFKWDGVKGALATKSGAKGGYELVFALDPSVYDGRYANNAWLQESPDPVTKLTWDNAACLSPKTAKELGVNDGDMLKISAAGKSLDIAVFITPGVAHKVVILPLGYGQKSGELAQATGFNVNVLRTTAAMHFASGATLSKATGHYDLASTQDYGSMIPTTERGQKVVEPKGNPEPRPLVRENTHVGYKKNPDFVEDKELLPAEKLKSLSAIPHYPLPKGATPVQQWGMSIDLNSCTGCGACTVACQAENNISVVGKERIMDGRELHWVRVDRYFTGSPEDPQMVSQPVPCQQCETAPCETVCPVTATAHSEDGLNDMVYNRCIGTRYCSNNCPYKVRRFNYFNFSKENYEKNALLAMQRNPNVTVRFRGVMEKCTYCVQRISSAKSLAKRSNARGVVPDGGVMPACGQTCPTQAITFGDVSDPNSVVSQSKRQNRNYSMLAELLVRPRTTYLAKIRNPNPALV